MKSREFLISDILDVSWGDTKTTKSSFVESGYIAYSAAGPDGFLPHADYHCDGVVLSAIGANCGVTYLASGQWSCIKNTIRILPKTSDIDIKYFYYLTCSPDFWPKRGSAQPFISQTDIRDLLIQISPIEIQKAIVGIIEPLDQKIRVNLQITSTLEQIAQTIFKSWFVDFAPVHAKARGEQPVGMDAETASLFPDSFEDSELGPIPSGWKVSPISECSKVVVGGTPSRKVDEYWGGTVPWINSGKTNEFRVTQPSEYITELGVQKSAAKIMPVGTTIMAMTGATLGQFSRMEIQACGTQNVIGILEDGTWPNEYIYFTIAFAMDKVLAGATGGAQQHVSKSIVEEIVVVNPGHALSVRFAEVVLPLFNQIANLEFQNHSLVEIRNSLLPRLISGDLEIPAELLEA